MSPFSCYHFLLQSFSNPVDYESYVFSTLNTARIFIIITPFYARSYAYVNRPNYSSLSLPAKTNITTFTAQTVYSYNAVRLWAAYGTACLAATLCVIIGLVTIIASGASYDNTFSTVFRVSREAKLANEIIPEDMDGKSPLPSYLAKTEVVLVERGEEQKGGLLEREG